MKKPEHKTAETARKPVGERAGNPVTTMAEDIAADIKRVRQREEKRLVTLARKSGFFGRRMSTAEITAMFQDLLKKNKTPKRSQLGRLEEQMNTVKRRKTAQERKDDARRKILLGAFLMAQIAHRPDEFTWLAGALENFLDTHPDATVAANNKLLMAAFLGEPDA